MMQCTTPASRLRATAGSMLPLAMGVAVLVASTVSSAHAQSTGIAACDTFLTKYDTCVTSKLPAEQRATYKAQLDQTRKLWLEAVKSPQAKATLEATCKQTMEAMKAPLESLGCTF